MRTKRKNKINWDGIDLYRPVKEIRKEKNCSAWSVYEARRKSGIISSKDTYLINQHNDATLAGQTASRLDGGYDKSHELRKIRMKGIPHEHGPKIRKSHCAYGESHHASVMFSFRSPDGELFEGANIEYFVKTHSHLFDQKDTEIKTKPNGGRHRNASSGLHRLNNGGRDQWKGWTK